MLGFHVLDVATKDASMRPKRQIYVVCPSNDSNPKTVVTSSLLFADNGENGSNTGPDDAFLLVSKEAERCLCIVNI